MGLFLCLIYLPMFSEDLIFAARLRMELMLGVANLMMKVIRRTMRPKSNKRLEDVLVYGRWCILVW